MLSLLVIVLALLALNLWALTRSGVAVRLPFALAVCSLLAAVPAGFAGLFPLPLPSQFLLPGTLWVLLIIPLAIICGVACTLVGLVVQAERALGSPRAPRAGNARRAGVLSVSRLVLLASIVLIVATAVAEALIPAHLFAAPVRGVEISTGTVVRNVRYGAAFAGTIRGDLDGELTATANYAPAFPSPAATNTIVGGSWSLAIYTAGRPRGVLFGQLTAGSVRWNVDVTEATMTATMAVSGGTGPYLGAHGSATFTGNLVHLTYPPTVAGTFSLHLT